MQKRISTQSAPAPLGPYSQAVLVDKTLYLSGQIGIDPKSGALSGDVEQETRQALANLAAVLAAAGGSAASIVKVTAFLVGEQSFGPFNTAYASFFAEVDTPPSRCSVFVAALPKGARVEVEAVAVLHGVAYERSR